MNISKYIPSLHYRARVRFIGNKDDPKCCRECTIIRVLPNPSERAEHQWYDVRFEDYSLGRFLEKYLAVVGSERKHTAA